MEKQTESTGVYSCGWLRCNRICRGRTPRAGAVPEQHARRPASPSMSGRFRELLRGPEPLARRPTVAHLVARTFARGLGSGDSTSIQSSRPALL
jgi:hypothetical protein